MASRWAGTASWGKSPTLLVITRKFNLRVGGKELSCNPLCPREAAASLVLETVRDIDRYKGREKVLCVSVPPRVRRANRRFRRGSAGPRRRLVRFAVTANKRIKAA